MRLKINITKEVLRKSSTCEWSAGAGGGDNKSPNQYCAIAEAINPLFRRKQDVRSNSISIELGGKSHSIKLPDEARNFINEFDSKTPKERREMKPFSFEVEIPDELICAMDEEKFIKGVLKTDALELIK